MRMWRTALIVSAGMTLLPTAPPRAAADGPKKDEAQADLQKFQGLWQTSPGGMEHRDGKQVVRNPVLDGPSLFVRGDRLIWLDEAGKPTGKEEVITLDVTADPRRITLTPAGGGRDEKASHGIYSAAGASLTLHLGLDGGPAPKQFLELNNPVKGVDGSEWLIHRRKLQGR